VKLKERADVPNGAPAALPYAAEKRIMKENAFLWCNIGENVV